MEQKTLMHEIVNEMYSIINMKKELDRWEALNALAIRWEKDLTEVEE